MPAGPPAPQGRVPEGLAFLGGLPEDEIARVGLVVLVRVHARAGANPREINLGELAVGRERPDAKIDRSFAPVSEALLLEPLDQIHHVIDMIGGAHDDFRVLQAEQRAVNFMGFDELVGVVAQ